MTQNQKQTILQLRGSGKCYREISGILNLPENTIKSFCNRNKKVAEKKNTEPFVCKHCGKRLLQIPKQKQKKFCSDKCRYLWWAEHPENRSGKALYILTCAGCGNKFSSYGNKNRKYCSHSCYISIRFAS